MKILIVRHGDPDYVHDSLTEKGVIEAQLLSDKLTKLDVKKFYCSPLGRAKKTASYTLERMGRTAEERLWLREFEGKCEKPHRPGIVEYCWDWMPSDWTKEPLFFDKEKWVEAPAFKDTNIKQEWERVKAGVDELLSENGYVHEGPVFKAVKPNNDTIVLFCHLGVEAMMVGYIFGISPMVLLHAFGPAPSSVTTLATEERQEGTACFRALSYGSTEHLYVGGEEPSFACRFCECFSNTDQRH